MRPSQVVCKQFWRSNERGVPAATCCKGCPIYKPCETWGENSHEGLRLHREAMDTAASEWLSTQDNKSA
jgi:hypothetical protein